MNITLDFHSSHPLTQQIAGQIQALVESGALPAGAQLPTVRQLAKELHVNFNTVARAYRVLDNIGLLSSRQGRGTYVNHPPGVEIIRRFDLDHMAQEYVFLALAQGYAPDEIALSVQTALSEKEKAQEKATT